MDRDKCAFFTGARACVATKDKYPVCHSKYAWKVSVRQVPAPEFEPVSELHIDKMWDWTGKSWGGLPDGTSILDHLDRKQSD